MIRLGEQAKRRWIAAGVVVGLIGVLGGFLALWPRDPNPPARFSAVHVRRDQGRGFSPDGRSYLVGDAQETTAWGLTTGLATTRKSPRSWGKSPVALKAFSRDRRHFAGWSVAEQATEQAVVWGDAATGEVRGRFPVKLPWDTILPRLAWIADIPEIRCRKSGENPVSVLISRLEIRTDTGFRSNYRLPGRNSFDTKAGY